MRPSKRYRRTSQPTLRRAAVGDPNGPPLRRVEILAALNRHGVEFILVGGVAAQAQGATKPTNDLDLCVRWTAENLDRVGAALTELDAGLRVDGADDPIPVPYRDGKFLAGLELSTWRTSVGDVDVIRSLPAPNRFVDFDELATRATTVTIDGEATLVASLDDIIVSKETVDRPPDRAALPELRALQAERTAADGR